MVLEGLSFQHVGFHALGCEDGSIEGDLQLPDATLMLLKTRAFWDAVFMICKRCLSCSSVSLSLTYVNVYCFYSRESIGDTSMDILRPNSLQRKQLCP